MDVARRFIRVIECEDGTWACRHDRDELDRFRDRDDASEPLLVRDPANDPRLQITLQAVPAP